MEGQSITQESSVSIPIIPQPRRLSVNPCATQPFRTPYVFLAVTDPEWARSKGRGGERRRVEEEEKVEGRGGRGIKMEEGTESVRGERRGGQGGKGDIEERTVRRGGRHLSAGKYACIL
jgi:hypothetical protein